MTREEAKELLSSFRPLTADAADPIFREALELARKDSDLGAWLAREQEFDQMLRQKLSSIRPPEGLTETILESVEGTASPSRSRGIGWLALAATVALAALLLSHQVDLFRGRSQRFESFYTDALAMVAVKPAPQLDLATPSLETTQAFIEQRDAPRLGRFPSKLQAMTTAGCRVFVWRQRLASLTCFELPSGILLHLVVIAEDALGGANLPSGLYSENAWHLMFQKKDGLILMWASQAPIDELKQLLVET